MGNFLKVALAAFTALIIAAGAGYWLGREPADAGGGESVEQAARQLLELTLPDANGQPQALRQWRGDVMVVNYWATWCAPCREEMPAFVRLQQKYAANGVRFIGIGIDSPDKIAAFAGKTPINYPLLIGAIDAVNLTTGLGNDAQGLPFTVLLDRQGRVVATRLGLYPEATLDAQIARLL